MELDDFLDRVTDRASFFDFVEALIADREDEVDKERLNPSLPTSAGANGWENGSIETYLDASLRCTEDNLELNPESFPEEPSWRAFANLLYRGKFYG